jgi:hypothetical protein
MDILSHIDKFKRQGFVVLGPSLLSSEEVNKLGDLVRTEFEAIAQSLPKDADTGMRATSNLLEHAPYVGVVVK